MERKKERERRGIWGLGLLIGVSVVGRGEREGREREGNNLQVRGME